MDIKKNHARNTLAGKPNALNIRYPATQFFCTLSVFIICHVCCLFTTKGKRLQLFFSYMFKSQDIDKSLAVF